MLGRRTKADRQRGDAGDRNRRAEPHHEGRGDAGPEQALRQRKDENDDGARTRPEAHRNDGGEAGLPAAGARQFLRLRPMGMAPGRAVVMTVIMSMAMIRMVMVVVAMIMMMIMMRMVVA